MDTEALVVDAFSQLGVAARRSSGALDHDVDLVIEHDGLEVLVEAKRRSLVTEDVARRLLASARKSGAVLLVVGDRVTDSARTLLIAEAGGYFDLRGRLALRAKGMVIDSGVDPITERTERADALSGRAGLEVAVALLLEPERRVGVRQLARELGRSASTVSDVLAALRRDGLVERSNTFADSRLFWQVADRWRVRSTFLANAPAPGDAGLQAPLRLGLDDVEGGSGWALTGALAASVYGAPVAVRAEAALEFLVPDGSVVRRAVTLLGAAGSPSQAAASVRVAPVPAAVERRVDLDVNPWEWPLAHPLFVALELAQDEGRGRDILDAWTPGEPWTRVW